MRYKQNRPQKFIYTQKKKKSTITPTFLLISVKLKVGYTLTGAFIFVEIEGKNQTSLVPVVRTIRERAAEGVWNLTCNVNVFDETVFRSQVEGIVMGYQQDVVRWVRRGYAGANRPDMSQQWNFPGAFLYSLTVITTIGELKSVWMVGVGW